MNKEVLRTKLSIRRWLMLFMIGLVISGATAFDVQGGITWIRNHVQISWANDWLREIYDAIIATNHHYPFLFYGYDWLAFAHIIIALAFIGPYRDPVKNEWVIQFGMIACFLVIPTALLFGAIRHIPLWWRMVDCSFGIAGIVPLFIVWRKTTRLKELMEVNVHVRHYASKSIETQKIN